MDIVVRTQQGAVKRCKLRSSVSGWLTIGTIQRSEPCPEREKR
jgi:hypothetical protein